MRRHATFSVIFLAAGRPHSGTKPALIQDLPTGSRTVDWLLSAFGQLPITPHIVGGYKIQEIAKFYPRIPLTINTSWSDTAPAYSLLLCPINKHQDLFVSYGDVVFNPSTIDSLINTEGDVVVAVDRNWETRYTKRGNKGIDEAELINISENTAVSRDTRDANVAEFCGLVLFRKKAVQHLLYLQNPPRLEEYRTSTILSLITELRANADVHVRLVNIGDDWSELDTPSDLANFVLGTKADTLDKISRLTQRSHVPERISFTIKEWAESEKIIINEVQKTFKDTLVAVRSSSLAEDTWLSSQAGAFDSFLDIDPSNQDLLADSVNKVIQSYPNDKRDHQILIQRMVQNVKVSGVAMTRTTDRGAPYYVVNYDDNTGKTDTVTAGLIKNSKSIFIHRSINNYSNITEPFINPLLEAIHELEQLVLSTPLDIEFAIDAQNVIHILQARPIIYKEPVLEITDIRHEQILARAEDHFKDSQRPSPLIRGNRAIYSNMSDWNPAEILGEHPRPLAKSIYKLLITDETWAKQRAEYGYRDVRPTPLLRDFAGTPYVDIRASINSFIPSDIEDHVAEKIVNSCVDKLTKNPTLHDKVEFEIIDTCWTAQEKERALKFKEYGLQRSAAIDLEDALKAITKGGFKRITKDIRQVKYSAEICEKIISSVCNPHSKAFLLLNVVRLNGALSFAHLARGGFVALAILKSFARTQVFDDSFIGRFLRSINTVAKTFTQDIYDAKLGKTSFETIITKYGHLRPGTYEITIQKYSENPAFFLEPMIKNAKAPEVHSWSLSAAERRSIDKALEVAGMDQNADSFLDFCKTAIEGREWSKFEFTKGLSAALDYLSEFGHSHGLTKRQLAFLPINDIEMSANISPYKLATDLATYSLNYEEDYEAYRTTLLPPFLQDTHDFYLFKYHDCHPTYVTKSTVIAPSLEISKHLKAFGQLSHKIIMIPTADPGFDWIFGHNIKGLITMYGGPNSHMTIRASEFGLPAAIGVGESKFNQLLNSSKIYLDCENNKIESIR